jgi:hypothetical protein
VNDRSHTNQAENKTIAGHGFFVGYVPDGWQPHDDGYERGVPPWTPEQWASWSPEKRQAMFELWDELAYLSKRPSDENITKLTYAQAMYLQALS